MTIDKQALREAAERAKDNFIPNFRAPTQDVLALLDELEAADALNKHLELAIRKAEGCSEVLRRKAEAAEKRNVEQQRSLDHRKFLLLSADEVQRDFAETLGCAGDNESIMEAIDDLKQHIAELESKNGNLRTIAHEQNELAIRANLDSINDAVEMDSLHKHIAELEAKLETADKLQDSAFRDGLKAGFSYGQTDDQSGFAQCMSAYSTRAGIGVKQQEDSVDSDVGRNQPGMVVAVHIGAGDFVKVKGQVFEVEETDFDDHDVTLWFVGGNTLKCAAGCPVEVVSAPVAAGIKVKGE